MQTAEQRAEFQEAYRAWTEVRNRHENEMLAIFRGETIADEAHLLAQADEMIRAHKRFMDAGAPFIGRGPRLA
ncbi:hypothetical protein [Paraburkholderia kururiensis]|uniref:hypothetical protein n=1 Tax=Paraburkholderia kururiensis TaxID=984307 RepID=UPI0005AA844A|nr:hypothetical protein [Paraburkholderia kururiensis]